MAIQIDNTNSGVLTLTTDSGAGTTLTLPTAFGETNQWVKTNGSGTLYFSGSLSGAGTYLATASPNNTINASVIQAGGISPSIAINWATKGTSGYYTWVIPDGASLQAGNARGPYCIDFSTPSGGTRTGTAYVANGYQNVLIGYATGILNTNTTCKLNFVSGNTAVIGSSTAAMTNSVMLSANNSTMVIGALSTPPSFTAVIGCVNVSNISNSYSVLLGVSAGGTQGTYSESYTLFLGAYSFSSGFHCARRKTMVAFTTGATTTPLTSDGSGATTAINCIRMGLNSGAGYTVTVVASCDTGTNYKSWSITGNVRCGATAATAVSVGSTVTVNNQTGANAATWVVAAAIDTTLPALLINVTGTATTNICWSAMVEVDEARFN
jgi:hypothetical protein